MIIIFCALIIVIIFLMILLVNNQKKDYGSKIIKEGIEVGGEIPQVNVQGARGQEVLLQNLLVEKENYIVLIDDQCSSCKDILQTIPLYNKSILKSIIILITNSAYGDNDEDLKKTDNVYHIDFEFLLNKMNTRSFPFMIKVDEEGKLLSKEFITYYSILDVLKNKNRRIK